MHVSVPAFLTAAVLASSAQAFSASANTNVAYYWGQNSAGGSGTQESLAYYCETEDADIMVLAFLNTFYSTGGYPTLAFGGSACSSGTYLSGTSLLQCPDIAADIATCQSLGKKVLLSLGGASGSYGFTSDSEAEEFATELWNLFGGGSSSIGRPFEDAIIDGFDLDIEGGSTTGYAAFADKMREYYDSDTSRAYYLSAAPQCPYPDAYVGTALSNSVFDFIFVQFYNNYCGMNAWEADAANANFNYDTWDTFVKSSPNPDAKLFLGVPGSSSAAGSGYTSASTVGQAANYLQETYDTFGGIMVWDASQAWANTDGGETFAAAIKSALLSDSAANSGSASTSIAVSTSAAASTSAAPSTSAATYTSAAAATSVDAIYSSSEDTTTTSLTETETSTSVLNTFYTTSAQSKASSSIATAYSSSSVSSLSQETPTEVATSYVSTTSAAVETPPSSSDSTSLTESSSAVETSPAIKTTSSAADSSTSAAQSSSPDAQISLPGAAEITSSADSSTSLSSATFYTSPSSSSAEAVVVVTDTAAAQTATNTPHTTADAGTSPTSTITLSTSVTGVPTSSSEPEIFTSWGANGPVVVVYHTVWVTTTAAGPTEVVTQYQTNEHYAYATQVIDVRRRKRRNRLSGPAQTSFAIKN